MTVAAQVEADASTAAPHEPVPPVSPPPAEGRSEKTSRKGKPAQMALFGEKPGDGRKAPPTTIKKPALRRKT